MKLKLFFSSLMILWSLGARPNIYNCQSPKSEPVGSEKKINFLLSVTNNHPVVISNQLNRENLEFKKPFLIYYAIDSSEAFMQYSVRFEIAKLQQVCRDDENINFIAFLNSLYLEKNSFIICKNKQVTAINLNNYKSINSKLLHKKKLLQSEKNLGQLTFKIKNQSLVKDAFKKFPLAHPDFLFELISFSMADKSLFPIDEYAPFINLKSHGSQEHILAGMHECQIKAKELSSKEIIKKILSEEETKFLEDLNNTFKVEQKLGEYDRIISKLNLGTLRGIGKFNEDPKLGSHRLSSHSSNFNNSFAGLGVDQGLGSEYSFGTNQQHLTQILNKLFKSESNRSLAFLMLESCESNRNPSIFHNKLSNIFGYYTAIKSLWYRNLNWWEILKDSDGITGNTVHILQNVTSMIPNIELISYPEKK